MDFDHRDPGMKSFRVMTGRAMLMSTSKVLAEVAKCDIVCQLPSDPNPSGNVPVGRGTVRDGSIHRSKARVLARTGSAAE
jgi:hypothetical protein